jgi:hypothetical protein
MVTSSSLLEIFSRREHTPLPMKKISVLLLTIAPALALSLEAADTLTVEGDLHVKTVAIPDQGGGENTELGGDLLVDGELAVNQNSTLTGGDVQTSFKVESNGVVWSGTGASFNGVEMIPEGAGSRFMWLPQKHAFRAERSNSQSDIDSIGSYSTAFGSINVASGNYSAAWGEDNTVSGDYATAWGWNNRANGHHSTAWGKSNTVGGHSSTVWGSNNTASGYHSTVWGNYNAAESVFSTVFGRYNIGGFTFSDDSDDTNDGNTQWFDVDPLFEIGLGDDNLARANALTLLKDGRIALGEHTSLNGLQTQPETVQIEGALKVGDYAADPGANASEGAIRFADDGSGSNDLLGYVDGTWKSLTATGGANGIDQTLSINGDQLTISGSSGNTVTLPTSADATDGLSAYQIWLAVGNTGTETEFLASLVGPAGADGSNGVDGQAGDSYFAENGGGDVSLVSANLGIGTATPTARLDVNGNTRVSGNLAVEGTLTLATHQGDIPMYQPLEL